MTKQTIPAKASIEAALNIIISIIGIVGAIFSLFNQIFGSSNA